MTAMQIARFATTDADFEACFRGIESRREQSAQAIDAVVRPILEDVRQRGDDALIDATECFDGYHLDLAEIEVSREEIEQGASQLPAEDRDALRFAAERVRRFHGRNPPRGWLEEDAEGLLGQRVRALERVGLYVPGGKAPLASTVLMLGIPAVVAGVAELVVTTPGRRLHPAVLEAIRLVGVKKVFRIGGAQAIAALAYGTDRIRRVDKIVGPGNAYVQAAKRLVFGRVAIDAEAGPSEVFIVADETAPASFVAADLLAQAEHDEMASVVLATPNAELVAATHAELVRQIENLSSAAVASCSLAQHSALILTRDLEQAVVLANRYGAEHLELLTRDPQRWLERIENAGAIFLGPMSPVPLGDYVAGPSHVLPTGGTARFFSVVGVWDFVKRSSVIGLSQEGLQRIGPAALRLAQLEGLDAHGRAVRLRLDGSPGE